MTRQVREGSLSGAVRAFLAAQPEVCDPAGVVVESMGPKWVCCAAPAMAEDCEDASPFAIEVRFRVEPAEGRVERLD
jgi:hypothetical protein